MRGRSLICIAFAWVCSFCKGKQSFRLSSLIYKWNCHVSTHGSRRGSRHVPASRTFGWIFVSTHGSLAGADRGQNDCRRGRCCFNSRLPCGSRPWMPGQVCNSVRFNSRLPCGSRLCRIKFACEERRFNSRLPCGSRLFSILIIVWMIRFQLTAPLREPTQLTTKQALRPLVSTHGSLAGADLRSGSRLRNYQCVSTHGSLAGADTIGGNDPGEWILFQLTAPLREPTRRCTGNVARIRCFNSRLPCGSRRFFTLSDFWVQSFNSRLPCGSRHSARVPTCCAIPCFNSRLPCGSRHYISNFFRKITLFQLTAPLREPTTCRPPDHQ